MGGIKFEQFPDGREVIGVLVTRRIASYRDLDEYFSADDALDMFEMLRVADYNEWQVMDYNEKRMKAMQQNG